MAAVTDGVPSCGSANMRRIGHLLPLPLPCVGDPTAASRVSPGSSPSRSDASEGAAAVYAADPNPEPEASEGRSTQMLIPMAATGRRGGPYGRRPASSYRRMGRNLPPPAGASTETAAGRKRKGASLATPAPSKRLARTSGGWASLPTDIVHLVLCGVLDSGGDIVDYIAFRGVCFYWRACIPLPRERSLRTRALRARDWVPLCDGDGVRPDDACEIAFFHTRTGRRIRAHPPEIRRHRIVGFTDGLVILLHKSTTAVRVLNPFTRVTVDLPPLAHVYREEVRRGQWKDELLGMQAAVCGSANSIAVVVWSSPTAVVLAAEPCDSEWKVLHRPVWPAARCGAMLPFQGKLYTTFSDLREIVQLYPPTLEGSPVVVAHIPDVRPSSEFFLVESDGEMLLIIQTTPCVGFTLYAVRLRSSGGGIGKLIPKECIGDRALFLGARCLSVSARDLPSLSGNSIYYSASFGSPEQVHSLTTGLKEQLADSRQIHNRVDRIRPSVRPFTIADHLLTYCHPWLWAQGLMSHEYQIIPSSFKELWQSIGASNSKLRMPPPRVKRQ